MREGVGGVQHSRGLWQGELQTPGSVLFGLGLLPQPRVTITIARGVHSPQCVLFALSLVRYGIKANTEHQEGHTVFNSFNGGT